MAQSFRFVALDRAGFAHLFAEGDEELKRRGIRRLAVDRSPGFPCRISLADAEIGETILALSFLHHDVASPYRASGPIFVREAAHTAFPKPDQIPIMLEHRVLSVRGYDEEGMMLSAMVVEGKYLRQAIGESFDDSKVRYLHVHHAAQGCFSCRVVRV